MTKEFELTSTVYAYNVASTVWSRVSPAGSSTDAPPDGLFGHISLVYNNAIYIYGGRRILNSGNNNYGTYRSSYLTKFDPTVSTFTTVLAHADCQPGFDDCMATGMHTATIVHDRYMVVVGGCPFFHGAMGGYIDAVYECATNSVNILDLHCTSTQGWITAGLGYTQNLGGSNAFMERNSHTAVYRAAEHKLVIMGGFNGAALNDVVEFVVPTQFCNRHRKASSCRADSSGCWWNTSAPSATVACVYLSLAELMEYNVTLDPADNCTNVGAGRSCEVHVTTSQRSVPCDPCMRDPYCSGCVPLAWDLAGSATNCLYPNATTCNPDGTPLASTVSGDPCTQCGRIKTCAECTAGWNSACAFDGRTCYLAASATTTTVAPPASCAASCEALTSETDCYNSRGGCHWCTVSILSSCCYRHMGDGLC